MHKSLGVKRSISSVPFLPLQIADLEATGDEIDSAIFTVILSFGVASLVLNLGLAKIGKPSKRRTQW